MADALFSAPFGLFGRQKIRAMIGRKLIRAEIALRALAAPAGEPRPQDQQGSLSRSRELPAGARVLGPRAAAKPQCRAGVARGQRRGARERHRLCRAADGAARAQAEPFRRRKPEELDRPARHFHPPHRRRREAFDDVPLDYKGELWLEISPRSFSVRVKAGSKLSQVRFRSRHPQQRDKHTFTLDDAEIRKRHLLQPARRWRARPARRRGAQDRSWRLGREHRRLSGDQEQRRHRRQSRCAATPWRISGSRFTPATTGG